LFEWLIVALFTLSFVSIFAFERSPFVALVIIGARPGQFLTQFIHIFHRQSTKGFSSVTAGMMLLDSGFDAIACIALSFFGPTGVILSITLMIMNPLPSIMLAYLMVIYSIRFNF
jgi:hypothetical protein